MPTRVVSCARVGRLSVATLLVLAFAPAPADAALRTGSSSSPDQLSDTSASFPGLKRLSVRYDDTAGDLTVTATLRDVLVDPSKTSALRRTEIGFRLGDLWGTDLVGSCNWGYER